MSGGPHLSRPTLVLKYHIQAQEGPHPAGQQHMGKTRLNSIDSLRKLSPSNITIKLPCFFVFSWLFFLLRKLSNWHLWPSFKSYLTRKRKRRGYGEMGMSLGNIFFSLIINQFNYNIIEYSYWEWNYFY